MNAGKTFFCNRIFPNLISSTVQLQAISEVRSSGASARKQIQGGIMWRRFGIPNLVWLIVMATTVSVHAQVGATANRSFKMPLGSFIATWDGRVAIYPAPYSPSEYRWEAYVIRYENLKKNALGEPQFSDPAVYSPVVTLDADLGIGHPQNRLAVNGRMHLALAPDPDFKMNPFPSDGQGRPLAQGKDFVTYRGLIVGQAQMSKHYKPTRAIPGLFVVSTVEIVVKNPQTSQAEIHSARVLEEGKVIRETASSEPFFGFEPTLSSDGRLLIYAGHPINGGIHFIMYSYNPNPKRGTGWSKPRHLTEMYWVHGPGSGNETLVDGVEFSDRYPIAKNQLRDPYGVPFQRDDGYPGAYPWLSLDNGDLFCSTVATFFAARRAGYAVIGSMTGWAAKHIDGAVNVSRSNVTGRSDVWTSTPEGAELERQYNLLTDESGRPFGPNAFQRIMISPIAQFPSMWHAFLDSDGPRSLPFSRRPHTFGAILSHSDRYVEISLDEATDGNYVLFLPMNEGLLFDRKYMQIMEEKGEVKDWNDNLNMVRYDPARTPDTSGQFQTGLLRGAQFPFEYFKAVEAWKKDRILKDRIVGLEGNSIYFPPRASVEVPLSKTSVERIQKSQQWNVSAAFRTYGELAKEALLLWENHLFLQIQEGDLVLLGRQKDQWVTVHRLKGVVRSNRWHHVSVNSGPKGTSLYWDGVLAVELKVILDLPKGSGRLWLGPSNSQSKQTTALMSIDEVSISDVLRTAEEISIQAKRQAEPPSQKTSQAWTSKQRELGEKLFFDPILSKNNQISCATCHDPQKAFQDGREKALGLGIGARNTPSLWNVADQKHLMWDGKVQSLVEQALLPIANPVEMALPIEEAVRRVQEKYGDAFKEAFGGPVTSERLGASLAAFQMDLRSPETAWDLGTLTDEQLQGRGLFFGKARCASCHQGTAFTDHRFHNLGFLAGTDLGHAGVSGRASDRGKFKTPGLRSVSKTAPYFHDGRFKSLDEVLEFYNRGGDTTKNRALEIQPLGLNATELKQLREFLQAL